MQTDHSTHLAPLCHEVPTKTDFLSIDVISLILSLVGVGSRGKCLAVAAVTAIFFFTGAVIVLLVNLEGHTPEYRRIVLRFADIRCRLAVPVPKKRDPEGEW